MIWFDQWKTSKFTKEKVLKQKQDRHNTWEIIENGVYIKLILPWM